MSRAPGNASTTCASETPCALRSSAPASAVTGSGELCDGSGCRVAVTVSGSSWNALGVSMIWSSAGVAAATTISRTTGA